MRGWGGGSCSHLVSQLFSFFKVRVACYRDCLVGGVGVGREREKGKGTKGKAIGAQGHACLACCKLWVLPLDYQ